MRNITLLPTINRNCVTFEIDNLLIRDPNVKTYDLFVEFGDGAFTSFQTKETDNGTGRTTIYSKFGHTYHQQGAYKVKGCFKAVYSDDGDPLYPTIPSLEIKSMGEESCASVVASKQQLPRVARGPSVLGSHMPKYDEKNVYVLNYQAIQHKAGSRNQLMLFYNEKDKPYTQWDVASQAGSRARHSNSVRFISSGTVQQLVEQSGYNSDDPKWRTCIDNYNQYISFEVSAVDGSHQNNIFLDLTGHKELESAIREQESSGKEHVQISVCHVATNGNSLELIDSYLYSSPPLTRFHDPNYIYVSPEFVDPDEISTTIWTYDLSIANDGKGTASDVKAHVVLNTDFFDLSTIIGVETGPFRHDRMELEQDGVSFYWDDIALPGIDFPADNKLSIRFSIQPKTRYVMTDKLSAHAVVDMYSGSIKETTLTEETAITEIVDSDRTRQLNVQDVLQKMNDTQRTV